MLIRINEGHSILFYSIPTLFSSVTRTQVIYSYSEKQQQKNGFWECSYNVFHYISYFLFYGTGYNSTQATTYSPPLYYPLANTSTEQNKQDPPVIPPSYTESSVMEHKPVLHPPRQEKDQKC